MKSISKHAVTRTSTLRGGFAIVMSLIITSILVVLVSGLLIQVVTSQRALNVRKDAHRESSNAQLAARIALNDLQVSLGLDTRVTVPSNLFIERDSTRGRRNLVGVLDSKEWSPYDEEDNDTERHFLRYLVSRADKDGLPFDWNDISAKEAQDYAVDEVFDRESNEHVTLLGTEYFPRSEQEHVGAQLIHWSEESPAQQGQQGKVRRDNTEDAVAYWAEDNSMFVRPVLPRALPDDEWNRGFGVTSGLGPADLAVVGTALGNYDSPYAYEADATKVLNYPTRISLLLGSNSGPTKLQLFRESVGGYGSYGLFTDTRRGGFRHDLSLAFGQDLEQFNDLEEFHNTDEYIDTNGTTDYSSATYDSTPVFYSSPGTNNLPYGYLYQIYTPIGSEPDSRYRGPSWDALRNHYRSYLREWETQSATRSFRGVSAVDDSSYVARPRLPLDYSQQAESLGGGYNTHITAGSYYNPQFYKEDGSGAAFAVAPSEKGEMERLSMSDGSLPTGRSISPPTRSVSLQPLVVRMSMVFGGVQKPITRTSIWNEVLITIDPFMVIWNPYDVPISFYSIGIATWQYNGVRFGAEWTNRFDRRQMSTTWAWAPDRAEWFGSIEYRLEPKQSGLHTMQPGEFMTVSVQKADKTFEQHYYRETKLYGTPSFSAGPSGFAISPLNDREKIVPVPDTDVTLHFGYTHASNITEIQDEIRADLADDPGDGAFKSDRFYAYMIYPEGHNGEAISYTENLRLEDDSTAQGLDFYEFPSAANLVHHGLERKENISKTINENQIPTFGNQRFSLMAVDLNMKDPLRQGVAGFAQYNPKALVQEPRAGAVRDEMSAAWEFSYIELNGDFTLNTDVYDRLADFNDRGLWRDYSKLIMYEVPRRPLRSLASLGNMPFEDHGDMQGMAIGQSFPNSLSTDLTKTYEKGQPLSRFFSKFSSRYFGQVVVDSSWAANEALWDRYFFSGLHWGGDAPYQSQAEALEALAEKGAPSLANLRALPGANIGTLLEGTNADGDTITDTSSSLLYQQIARYLIQVESFNVNTVEVRTWANFLSGAVGNEVALQNELGEVSRSSLNGARFSRFNLPHTNQAPAAGNSEMPSSTVTLSSGEINRLALAIVEEVKERGPFMTLADFINRDLASDDQDHRLRGALQAAIEQTGLNNVTDTSDHETLEVDDVPVMAGMPGHLTQGDLLNSIGGALTTRGDTFTVVVYGGSYDTNEELRSQGRYAEIVVQRMPELISGESEAVIVPSEEYPYENPPEDGMLLEQWSENEALSDVDRRFGRRMRIVSFRWLTRRDI